MDDYQIYPWVKALHLISMTAWMAGMLYLPRLFVYHHGAPVGSAMSEIFKLMEVRLLRIIINPAMVATFIFGIWLIDLNGGMEYLKTNGWLHTKILLLLFMFGLHGFLAKTRKQFALDQRPRTARFFRIINEVPMLLLAVIIVLAVVKPF